MDVLLDRPVAELQFAGDFFVRKTASNQKSNLTFAIA